MTEASVEEIATGLATEVERLRVDFPDLWGQIPTDRRVELMEWVGILCELRPDVEIRSVGVKSDRPIV